MLESLFGENILLLIVVLLWIIIWKGLALWFSARRREKWWFIAMLLLNTLGILEIIYIFLVAKVGGEIFGWKSKPQRNDLSK